MLGIILLVVIAVVLFAVFGSKGPDFDALLAEKKAALHERAKRKLGFEEEEVAAAPCIELAGYNVGKRILHDKTIDNTSNQKDGKTGLWRGPEACLTGFYFSEDHISVYQWRASLVSDTFRESTSEVYYTDIVSVKMLSEEGPEIDPKTGNENQSVRVRWDEFTITDKGADSITGFGPQEQLEAAVTAMRTLLKQKKNA